jgi:hypothetical protein
MNERGIALPTALIALAILTSLSLAFAMLGGSEPVVADNHLRGARARALAESGIERAMWGLSTGTIPATPADALAPYDGSVFTLVSSLGGFTVAVRQGADGDERQIEAVGWTPDQGARAGVRKIQTRVVRIRLVDPVCAICSRGALDVTGNASIDARTGGCPGMSARAGTMTLGQTTVSGAGKVYGPDGDDSPNSRPGDVLDNPDPASPVLTEDDFDFLIDQDKIAILKDLAKRNGTYFQGSQIFNNSRPLPNGIVFVDTTTGAEFTAETPSAEAGRIVVDGNITWSGWVIVAGRAEIKGTVNLTGLVYAQNEVILTGNGAVSGAIVSENRKDTVASVVSTATGSFGIQYDCQAVRTGGGQVPEGWFVKAGTFQEIAGR